MVRIFESFLTYTVLSHLSLLNSSSGITPDKEKYPNLYFWCQNLLVFNPLVIESWTKKSGEAMNLNDEVPAELSTVLFTITVLCINRKISSLATIPKITKK